MFTEKAEKKFSMRNYFKSVSYNKRYPQSPLDMILYKSMFNDIPVSDVSVEEPDWFYKVIVEYQKGRGSVYHQQFFTPYKTAMRMAEILKEKAENNDELYPTILDACCGFGQLSIACSNTMPGVVIVGFDFSYEMIEMNRKLNIDNSNVGIVDLKEYNLANYDYVISNPPYEMKDFKDFLELLVRVTNPSATIVMLVPVGYVDRERPKEVKALLENFTVIHREPMTEPFYLTKIQAEIVVLRRRL